MSYNVALERKVLPAAVAAVALVVGDLVVKNAAGQWAKADANGTSTYPAVGVVTEPAGIGARPEVSRSVEIGGYTGLTADTAVYLSETAGDVTQTAPAYHQQVGMALDATTILFDIRPLPDEIVTNVETADVVVLTDQSSDPSAPAAGTTKVYTKSGEICQRTASGVTTESERVAAVIAATAPKAHAASHAPGGADDASEQVNAIRAAADLVNKTIKVGAGESVQAAVDKAANTATNGTPIRVVPAETQPRTINRDFYTQKILQTDNSAATGVIVEKYRNALEADRGRAPFIDLPMWMFRVDDIRKQWVQQAAGSPILWDMSGTATGITKSGITSCYNQDASSGFSISTLAQVDELRTSAPTRNVRIAPAADDAVDSYVYFTLTGDLDISSAKYFAVWAYLESGTMSNGAVQIGFSEATDFAGATFFDLPGMIAGGTGTGMVPLLLDLSATDLSALNAVKTFGVKIASDEGAFVLRLYDPRVAAHPFIGISPSRYAAQLEIPITHAAIANEIGNSGIIMDVDDLYRIERAHGAALAAHVVIDSTTDYAGGLEATFGAKRTIDEMVATDAAYTIKAMPSSVDGFIQPGDNPINFKTLDAINGWEAQLVMEHFDWSMGYARVNSHTRHFGESLYNVETAIAAFSATSPPVENIVILAHYISETGSEALTCSYAELKTLFDLLSGWQEAGRGVCVTASTYFGATQPPELAVPAVDMFTVTHNGTPATSAVYVAPIDSIYGYLNADNSADNADDYFETANGSKFLVNDNNGTAVGYPVYFDEDGVQGERLLINNTITGTDLLVRSSDGTYIKIKHSADAATTGVALYFDDDEATTTTRLNADLPGTTDITNTLLDTGKACPRAKIRGHACESVATGSGWDGESNISVSGGRFVTPAGTRGYVFTEALQVLPGQRYGFSIGVNAQTTKMFYRLSLKHYYYDSNAASQATDKLPFSQGWVSAGVTDTVVRGCFTAPKWAYKTYVMLELLPNTGEVASADNARQRQL